MITASNVFSGIPPLFTSLSKILSGDIDCSHQGIESHSTDGSPYAIRSQAVLYPKNTTDIKHVIAFSREYRMPITVRGGGTAGTGGALGEGIVVDMTRYFTHIRQVNMMEHTITVDAGVTLRELKEKLMLWNMEIPVLQGEDGEATVGGFVATKSATASSFHAGTIREWIEGATVVVDTGEEHHIKDGITPSGRLLGIYQSVFPALSEHGPTLRAARREESDDATGYFLWSTSIGPRQLLDQLIGSEGTLGIITSVTFRVTLAKRHTVSLLLPLSEDRLETAADIARHHRAEALYMFDTTYRRIWEKLRPDTVPPGFEESAFYLLVTLRDNDEHLLSSRVATFLRLVSFARGIKIDGKLAHWLTSYETIHKLLLEYSQGTHLLATLGQGIIVPRRVYKQCLEALNKELEKTDLLYVLSGYAGSGHVSVTALMDPHSPSHEKNLLSYNEKICSVVERFKGGLSAVGGDGLEKSAYMSFVYNEATLRVFALIKEAWDPLSIFNPSKKTGIPLEYLKKHMRSA